VKNKILPLFLILAVFSFSYCKKETSPSIVGQWISTALYIDPATGGDGWTVLPERSVGLEIAIFKTDASFSFSTDMPAGHGIFDFNYSTYELYLHYTDRDGNPIGTVLKKVESLTNDKLIISSVSVSSGIRKIEYSRFD
jgi:hypothetical protein